MPNDKILTQEKLRDIAKINDFKPTMYGYFRKQTEFGTHRMHIDENTGTFNMSCGKHYSINGIMATSYQVQSLLSILVF